MADYVLAALPDDTFPLISGYLAEKGDEPILYPDLKQKILSLFVPTPEERAEKLMSLTRLPIGDQRASAAFAEMEALTRIPTVDNKSKTLDLLRVLWLMRLPDSVRAGITNFMDQTKEDITKLADSLQGAHRAHNPVLAAQEDTHDDDDADGDAEGQIAAAYRRSQQRPSPGRRPWQNTNNTPSTKNNNNFCFYHRRFGFKAKRCQEPCAWAKNL